MILLEPIAHSTIWGGSYLCRFFNGQYNKIGHMYSLYDNEVSNRIMNGEYKGKTINDWFQNHKKKYGLEQFSSFPIVLAIVEAEDSLSIQVHPDDACAQNYEHVKWGKNESWFFLKAPQNGWIYAGCNVSDINVIPKMIEEGRGEEIAQKLFVEPGDYVYVGAGTLHAMTKGSLVYEIEENSEFTYRLYDFERTDTQGMKRELHIDKAIAALKLDKQIITQKYDGKEISERLYITSIKENEKAYKNNSATLECITFLCDPKIEIFDSILRFGMTIILEPGEVLPVIGEKIMVARLNMEVD